MGDVIDIMRRTQHEFSSKLGEKAQSTREAMTRGEVKRRLECKTCWFESQRSALQQQRRITLCHSIARMLNHLEIEIMRLGDALAWLEETAPKNRQTFDFRA